MLTLVILAGAAGGVGKALGDGGGVGTTTVLLDGGGVGTAIFGIIPGSGPA